MPTLLNYKYLPDWDGSPRGMSRIDFEIWEKWKAKYLKDAIAMYFNVGLGNGAYAANEDATTKNEMWGKLTQKRADVIIEYEKKLLIVELRDHAKLGAVGRLVAYKLLYEDDKIIPKLVDLILVSNHYDADVERLCIYENVKYECVDE